MKKIIFFFLFLVFIVNCSKDNWKNYTIVEANGVKVYKNQDKASLEDLVIVPREVFTIAGTGDNFQDKDREFVWPRFLDIDSKGHIFILDYPTASVKKFSKEGNFIKSFGRNGTGPGEMKGPYMIAILNDIVYIPDQFLQRVVTFDTNGIFINNIRLESGLPNNFQPVGKDKFIAFMMSFPQKENGIYFSFNLALMKTDFKPFAILSEYCVKLDPTDNNMPERFTPYAVSKDTIFVAQNSEKEYKIKAFNFTGKLKYTIEKPYKKMLYNKEELEELNLSIKAIYKKTGIPNYPPYKKKFKKAITSMYCDNKGRLWVRTSVNRDGSNKFDFLVDLFKDGIFIKRIKLDIIKGYDYLKWQDQKIFFKDNRIFYLEEDQAILKVFEY